jgi:hypothetical protein
MMDLESIIKEQRSSRRDLIYLILFRDSVSGIRSINSNNAVRQSPMEPYKSRHRAIVTAANLQRRCGLALADPPPSHSRSPKQE